MNYPTVKHQTTSRARQTGNMLPAAKVLAANLDRLLARMSDRPPRPELAARIGIGDKTLGFLKSGEGNPTLENVGKVAAFFRLQPWELLKPQDASDLPSQPVSGEQLMIATDLADESLRGLWLPKHRYFVLVSLALEGISKGLPYAEVLEFIRPEAQNLAKLEAGNDSGSKLGAARAPGHGRSKAQGDR